MTSLIWIARREGDLRLGGGDIRNLSSSADLSVTTLGVCNGQSSQLQLSRGARETLLITTTGACILRSLLIRRRWSTPGCCREFPDDVEVLAG